MSGTRWTHSTLLPPLGALKGTTLASQQALQPSSVNPTALLLRCCRLLSRLLIQSADFIDHTLCALHILLWNRGQQPEQVVNEGRHSAVERVRTGSSSCTGMRGLKGAACLATAEATAPPEPAENVACKFCPHLSSATTIASSSSNHETCTVRMLFGTTDGSIPAAQPSLVQRFNGRIQLGTSVLGQSLLTPLRLHSAQQSRQKDRSARTVEQQGVGAGQLL